MPKKTVKTILDSGNSYLIEVKGNQKGLLRQIKEQVANNTPLDTYLSSEKNRGRQENRYHEIYELTQTLADGWQSVQRIIYVHRYGHRPDKQTDEGLYDEQHYYISDYTFSCAKTVALGIRKHWGIENKIHHVKDTHFNEDQNGITHNHAAAILSVFQDIAINLYRSLGYPSVKNATITFANKIDQLLGFLNAKHINDL